MALPATEDFTGAAAALSGSWTQQNGATTVNKNGSGAGVCSGGAQSFAFWNADTFNAAQYAQLKIVSVTTDTQYDDVGVRMSGTGGSYNAYVVYTDGASGTLHTAIAKEVAGSETELLALTVTLAANDILRIEVNGTTISAYKNGVLIASTTDATFSSGSAGLGLFNTTASVDNWEGGNLVSGTPTPLLGNLFVGPVGFGR
jgi:hypothetical protein